MAAHRAGSSENYKNDDMEIPSDYSNTIQNGNNDLKKVPSDGSEKKRKNQANNVDNTSNKKHNTTDSITKGFKDGTGKFLPINSNEQIKDKENSSYNYAAAYRQGIPGPYSVWIRSKVAKEISQFKVGSLIYKKYPNITEICRRSRSKVEVILMSRTEANSLASDVSLEKHDMEAYIPGFKKIRRGIIKGIDTEFTEEDLLEGIQVPGFIKIIGVRRLNRKEKGTEASNTGHKWVATKSIVCSFEGQHLPDKVFVWGVCAKIEPYVQNVMQCYKCFKYGHTRKTCRGQQICFNCGEPEHQDEPCKHPTPHCANCKSIPNSNEANHVSVSNKCPKMIEQRKINNIMAYENLSFAEAKALVSAGKDSYMRNSITGKSFEEFPRLNKQITQTIESTTTNETSYALVATGHGNQVAAHQQQQNIQQQQHKAHSNAQRPVQQQQQLLQKQLPHANIDIKNTMSQELPSTSTLPPSKNQHIVSTTQKLYNRLVNPNQKKEKNSYTQSNSNSNL
ncbi:hypothetical protein TKK_0013946 [Trichogramma kaykai]